MNCSADMPSSWLRQLTRVCLRIMLFHIYLGKGIKLGNHRHVPTSISIGNVCGCKRILCVVPHVEESRVDLLDIVLLLSDWTPGKIVQIAISSKAIRQGS